MNFTLQGNVLVFIIASKAFKCIKNCPLSSAAPLAKIAKYSPSFSSSTKTSKFFSKYLLKSVQNYRAELLYDYDNINGIAIKIPSDKSIREAIRYFQQVKGVLSVNRDEVMQISK